MKKIKREAIICPNCGEKEKFITYATRRIGWVIVRYRQCKECGERIRVEIYL